MRVFTTHEEVSEAVGQELGVSDWLLVDQQRVDAFAEATDDHQWIHVDVERARSGPFGGPVAHGYLTLSLLPALGRQVFRVETPGPVLNYGLNRVRFPAPLPVGSRVRARVSVVDATDVAAGLQLTLSYAVEIEGGPKPACVAESVVLLLTRSGRG